MNMLTKIGAAIGLMALVLGAGMMLGVDALTLKGLATAISFSLFLGATTTGTVSEGSTPDGHKVRDVSDVLTTKMPARFPIDTIMRRLNLSEPCTAEKVEWEEDEIIPRETQANGAVTGGSSTDTLTVDNGGIYRPDDTLLLPDDGGEVVRVDAISGNDLTIRALAGGNVPAIEDNNRVIRLGNAKVEGFMASKSRTTMPSQRDNFVQAFDALIDITGRRKATANYTKNDWDRSRDRQLYDFRNNLENTLSAGKKSKQDVNGENLTTMGGLLEYITAKSLSYSASSFDEKTLLSWMRQVFSGNSGSRRRYLFADPYLVQDIAGISLDKVRRTQVESKTLEIKVDEIRTEFGQLVVVLHQGLEELGYQRFGMILDFENIRRRVLRPMKAVQLKLEENGEDKDALQLKETCSVEVRYDETHATISGSA